MCRNERIEITSAIRLHNYVPYIQFFHEKSKMIKFNRDHIIISKFLNRNEIFNEFKGMEDIFESSRLIGGRERNMSVTVNRNHMTMNRNHMTITNNNCIIKTMLQRTIIQESTLRI